MVIIAVGFYIADGYTDIKEIDYKLGLALGLFVGFVTLIFQLSNKEERPRVTALSLVFIVVIFFWMSFHQNGLTLTMYARDYTTQFVGPFTNLFFNLGPCYVLLEQLPVVPYCSLTKKPLPGLSVQSCF